jgi:hypothetical protein
MVGNFLSYSIRRPVGRATAGVKCLVLCVRSQSGWLANRGEQHRNIGRVTNQMARRLNFRLTWIGHHFRFHQCDQMRIVF